MSLVFDLVDPCGTNVVPGVEMDLYAVCACDIDTFPDVVGNTAQGDSITLDGDIVLKAGKKFNKIEIISETGEIKHSLVGANRSKSYKQSLVGKTVGNINYDEFFNNNANACFVVIAKPKSGGTMRVIGHPTKGHAMFATAEDTSGSNAETPKEWSFELTASPGNVAYHYNGLIDLTA